MGETDNQAAGKQTRETEYTKETSLQLCRGHPHQRQPGEDGNEEDQENQDETQVNGSLKITSQFPMQIL